LKGGMKKSQNAEWEGGISWSKFLLYCGIPSYRGFSPLLFEGEMKKSQMENNTMGFHGAKSLLLCGIPNCSVKHQLSI
jgi:hypothetical protein